MKSYKRLAPLERPPDDPYPLLATLIPPGPEFGRAMFTHAADYWRTWAAVTAISLLVITGLSAPASADWPQFLGPRRDGVVQETGLNLEWETRRPAVRWRVPLGSGYSSLAIVGERAFTTAKRGERDHVVCLDAASGKEIWTYDAAASYLDVQRHGAGPRSTPTVVGDRVFALFPRGELVCLSAADGGKQWQVNVFEATGAPDPHGETYYWGLSASPLVDGDLVYVQPGGNKDNSVAAFHRETGKLVWSAGGDPPGYSSPILIAIAGRRQLICPTGRSILGLDPAQGAVLWRYEFGNRFHATCATPVWADNLLVVSAAYGTGAVALELRQDGTRWNVEEKWKLRDFQNLFATSVVHDGHLYGCHGDLGAILLKCVHLRTGKIAWQSRRPCRFSLLLVEGRLLCLDEQGALRVFQATPTGQILKGEMAGVLAYKTWSTPALANGFLYARDEQHVVCLDLR